MLDGGQGMEMPDQAGPPRLPHKWSTVLAGLGLSALGALFCLYLVHTYVATRPVYLCDYTEALADVINKALVDNRIPEGNIRRGEPLISSDDGALWNVYEFEVDVPESIDGSGLGSLVGREMLRYDVSMSEQRIDNRQTDWALSLGNREFAKVHIHEKPRRTDLSTTCVAVANAIPQLLASLGFAPESVKRGEPELKGSETMVWCETDFSATLPGGVEAEAVRAMLASGLTEFRIEVAATPGLGGITTIAMAHAGVPCATLRLDPPLPAAEEPTLVSPEVSPETGVAPATPEETPPETVAPEAAPPADAAGEGLTPKAAIIVDDGGYGGEVTEAILALDTALTLSILPDAPHAADTAARAKALGFEVLLHMPMGPGTGFTGVTAAMTPRQMEQALADALEKVPGARGINNHMGSEFTANATAMTSFLEAVKSQPLFFVDSRTTAKTIAFSKAVDLGIPAASRNVFLDNESNPAYIREQLDELAELAKEKGVAIGICHFRPATADVLAEVVPALRNEGIKVVHVSEVVQ